MDAVLDPGGLVDNLTPWTELLEFSKIFEWCKRSRRQLNFAALRWVGKYRRGASLSSAHTPTVRPSRISWESGGVKAVAASVAASAGHSELFHRRYAEKKPAADVSLAASAIDSPLQVNVPGRKLIRNFKAVHPLPNPRAVWTLLSHFHSPLPECVLVCVCVSLLKCHSDAVEMETLAHAVFFFPPA